MKNTIYDIAQSYADKQEHIIDPLQREAPLFQNLPCQETSKIDKNIFDIVKDVAVPSVTDFDAPLPQLYATTETGFASLAKVGGRLDLPLDKCRILGKEQLIQNQLPIILNRAGMAFDYSFMYNTLRKFCIDHSGCATSLGATSNCYSMVGVTWGQGENYGLYSPKLSGQKMFDVYALDGGNITNIKNEKGEFISGYSMEIVTFLGIQLPRTDRVHALVNIDDSHLPTYKQLLDFVYKFRGYTNESVIFAHPLLINSIVSSFGTENTHADLIKVDDMGNIRIQNCRVVPDMNMLAGTEAAVTL